MQSFRIFRGQHFHMVYGSSRPWTLNEDLVQWLGAQGMPYEHVTDYFDEGGKTYIQQLITFENKRDAMLFKLTWV